MNKATPMTDLSLLRFWQDQDTDAVETHEWLESLQAVLRTQGQERVAFLLEQLARVAHEQGVSWRAPRITPYVNTIGLAQQAMYPGDTAIEARLSAIMRWNALAMVVRANRAHGELGGHIASYASAADLFEVGFHHFFRAASADHGGDLVYFQPHSAPGVYARAFVEGRLSADQLAHYRQELTAQSKGIEGLSSYPHPMLMPGFWQFPTGSMGIGPISAIYQARFMRYLQHRGLLDNQANTAQAGKRKVWGFFGDGEMDEPESMAGLSMAAREGLDNLVFVINCNLQRLDGPVRGNGRVIDELESLFAGAGWHVIKLVWGSNWDPLFARDTTRALARTFAQTVDGQFQTYSANDGAYNRQHFFGRSPELAALAGTMTDAQIEALQRGGHDPVKIHAAFASACAHSGQPTVILAKTMKGYGMGTAGQGKMTTHQQKKLETGDLQEFVERFAVPVSQAQIEGLEFIAPAPESPEARYLHARRAALGGYLPKRVSTASPVAVPEISQWGQFALGADGKEMSTTMAFVRMLGSLLKDANLGPRIAPIVADEARTFGMANLFRQVGIYSHQGQRYEPEDIGSVLYYREVQDGQILEEGISEAGALASWTAAATSYSTHGLAMLPFYIYYSMFGFQRVGDAIWAAADQRARGFLVGATAGRTTLGGEGLQHQDGTSHLVAATIPNCRAYDPAYAGELAVIMQAGIKEMITDQRDVFYYLTVMNENLPQPSLGTDQAHPHPDWAEHVLKGLVCHKPNPKAQIRLLGSGTLLPHCVAAAHSLADQGIAAEVWSVTSYSELARQAHAAASAGDPVFLHQQLGASNAPLVAVSDYVRAVPDQIRAYLPTNLAMTTLGTDGFGRSDTRAALRQHFGVDTATIVAAAHRMIVS
jgi:pyruvate dehydrogenase E1 component